MPLPVVAQPGRVTLKVTPRRPADHAAANGTCQPARGPEGATAESGRGRGGAAPTEMSDVVGGGQSLEAQPLSRARREKKAEVQSHEAEFNRCDTRRRSRSGQADESDSERRPGRQDRLGGLSRPVLTGQLGRSPSTQEQNQVRQSNKPRETVTRPARSTAALVAQPPPPRSTHESAPRLPRHPTPERPARPAPTNSPPA